MPLVTRTVIVYIDDELVEVDIEVEEPLQGNICRICEKVELERAKENDIICPECWLSIGPADPSIEDEVSNADVLSTDVLSTDVLSTDVLEDDDVSYSSFKEMNKKERSQSDDSSEGENI